MTRYVDEKLARCAPIVSAVVAAAPLMLLAALLPSCGDDTSLADDGSAEPETLPREIDPGVNVVEESPVDFAPTEGGLGQGLFEDSNPYTYVVLAQGSIDSAGDGNCGQFGRREGDLELRLGGILRPGRWEISDESNGFLEGEAHLYFAGRAWSGTAEIEEGSEEHGDTVAGTVDATSDEGERFAMSFQVLFHGCGVD